MRVGVVKEQDGGSAGIDVIRLTARSGRTTRDRDVHRSPDTQISLRRSTSNFTSPSSYRKELDTSVALNVFFDLRRSNDMPLLQSALCRACLARPGPSLSTRQHRRQLVSLGNGST